MRFAAFLQRIALTALFALCLVTPAVTAANVGYQVKAAYLYQFIKYVRWQSDAGNKVIGLVSPVDISEEFLSIDGKLFNESELEVRHIGPQEELGECCEVLFFAPGSEARLNNWVGKMTAGTVTIADEEVTNGDLAMVQLVRQATKLKFTVHASMAKERSVEFSSRLLRVAVAVD